MKIVESTYRYLRYGQKIGTAPNGNAVYQRRGRKTAFDINGRLLSVSRTERFNDFTTRTVIDKFEAPKKSKRSIITITKYFDPEKRVLEYDITRTNSDGVTGVLIGNKTEGFSGSISSKKGIRYLGKLKELLIKK